MYDSDDTEEFNHNKKLLHYGEEDQLFNSCSHAVVLYEDEYFDSNGISDCYSTYDHVVLERLVIQSIKNSGMWNNMFERKYVKKISKKLNVDLSDVDVSIYYEIK